MNSRKVYIKSIKAFIAWFLLWLVVGGFLSLISLGFLVDIPDGWYVLLLLALMVLVPLGAFYMAQIAACGLVNVFVEHDGISIIWEKNYLFCRKPERKILFGELAGVGHKRIGCLVIRLNDGSKIVLRQRLRWIGASPDFSDLVADLAKALPQYDQLTASKEAPMVASEPDEVRPVAGAVYKVKSTSMLAGFVGWFTIMFSLFLYIMVCIVANWVVIIIGLLLLILGIVYMLRNWIQQRMEVQVLADRIVVHYIYKPFFDRVQDRAILRRDIASYKINTYQGSMMTLYLTDGSKFRVIVGQFGNSDEFDRMWAAVGFLLEKDNPSSIPIARRETIYEGKSGMVIAVLLAVMIIALLTGIIFFPELHETSDVIRGIGVIIPALGMLFYIISLRKKV